MRMDQIDKAAIAEVILRERVARDRGRFDEMASCYHVDSHVEVSWFKGSGHEFVRQSREQFLARSPADSKDRAAFHEVGATLAEVRGDRATADTLCLLHSFFPLDGLDCKLTGYVRLLWRLQKSGERWLIAGMRCIYIRDLLTPCNPGRIPILSDAELAAYRASYRYLSVYLMRSGLAPCDDLPGEDRPETVVAIRQSDERWLEAAEASGFNAESLDVRASAAKEFAR